MPELPEALKPLKPLKPEPEPANPEAFENDHLGPVFRDLSSGTSGPFGVLETRNRRIRCKRLPRSLSTSRPPGHSWHRRRLSRMVGVRKSKCLGFSGWHSLDWGLGTTTTTTTTTATATATTTTTNTTAAAIGMLILLCLLQFAAAGLTVVSCVSCFPGCFRLSPCCLVGNGGMDIGDYYRGLYGDYYRSIPPFPTKHH